MMADLMSEYFERDLTDAEEQQVADKIAASPEEALRFAGLAQAAYKATGLPEMGSGGGFGRAVKGAILPLLGFVLLFGTAGLIIYKGLCCLKDSPPQASIPVALPAHLHLPAMVKPHLISRVKDELLEALDKPGMVKPVTYSSAKHYGGLDIMVDQKTAGILTVRVLNSARAEVRLLYAGMVAPGKWDFTWDGRLENGATAPLGTYHVEVQSGKEVLVKEINISGADVAEQK